ncbi:hypothetical protein PQR62_15695 [Herbaspirillum lusitanum]|uniref:Uncharacterized protein n=1 Tax=Herbaspirillum lusitanum TaxID=213312 RepID=A0ABW9ABW6_9BURK
MSIAIDVAKQHEILSREEVSAEIVRGLVAAGGQGDFVSRICGTAYLRARDYQSQGMMNLLSSLHADPEPGARCGRSPGLVLRTMRSGRQT